MPLEHLVGLEAAVAAGLAALTSIEARMRDHGGPDAAPKFEDLQNQFDRIRHVVRERIAVREKAQAMVEAKGDGPGTGLEPAPEPASTTVSVGPAAAGFAGGAITSRQDAIRALDAVAEFFGGTSRRVRFRCSSIGPSGWCRRIFSKCWPTSRPTRCPERGRRAD